MQFLHSFVNQRRGFIAGLIVASALSCSVAVAAPAIEAAITVAFPNLTMKFNGVAKAPPADQRPIMYNGRTYVPLRFVSEAMGHPVDFDGATQTIYVGSRPERNRPTTLLHPSNAANTVAWADTKKGDTTGSYGGTEMAYVNPAVDNRGTDRENAWVFEPWVCATFDCAYTYDVPNHVMSQKEYVLNAQFKELTGTLFPGVIYNGSGDGKNAGYLVVKDENDKVLYQSPWVQATGGNDDIPFRVDVRGVGRIKVMLVAEVLGHNRRKHDRNDVFMAQLGIENLGLN